jgi:hypothetical protein
LGRCSARHSSQDPLSRSALLLHSPVAEYILIGAEGRSMTQTSIQKAFKPFKDYLPNWLWKPIRNVFTAILTPVLFSLRSGHFRSSFKGYAVSAKGEPIPWYTYPCIEFLRQRSYEDKRVLEFGGGQSTLWWARLARHIVTFEGDIDWYNQIKVTMPANVDLHYVSMVPLIFVFRKLTKYWIVNIIIYLMLSL